jgi:hypothetical protein
MSRFQLNNPTAKNLSGRYTYNNKKLGTQNDSVSSYLKKQNIGVICKNKGT